MPTVNLREKSRYDYVFIDDNNEIHLMVPLVGGDTIGLDNTCQALGEINMFFERDGAGDLNKKSAWHVLNRYKMDIEFDLDVLSKKTTVEASELRAQKTERLQQINVYLSKLTIIAQSSQLAAANIGQYPRAMKELLQTSTNCFTIRLSPAHPDLQIKFDTPIFSLNRGGVPGLGTDLRNVFQAFYEVKTIKNTSKDAFFQAIINALANKPRTLAIVKKVLTTELRKTNPALLDTLFDTTRFAGGALVDEAYIKDALLFDANTTLREYVEGVFEACLDPDEIFKTSNSLFNQLDGKPVVPLSSNYDKASILIQFFLAQINVYCYANDLSKSNFGIVFDQSRSLCSDLITLIKEALRDGLSVEKKIIAFMNANKRTFQINRDLTSEEITTLINTFTDQYTIIQGSPHFDEFVIFLPEKKGTFIGHLSRISCPFSTFVEKTGKKDRFLESRTTALNQTMRASNRLPHANSAIASHIDISERDVLDALNEGNVHKLVGLLLLDDVTNPKICKLFQSLTKEIKDAVCLNKLLFIQIMTVARTSIEDQALLTEFENTFSTTASSLQINLTQLNQLYSRAIQLDKTISPIEPAKSRLTQILTALGVLPSLNVQIQNAAQGGFVVTASKEKIDQLKGIIQTSKQTTLRLSPEMIQNLLQQLMDEGILIDETSDPLSGALRAFHIKHTRDIPKDDDCYLLEIQHEDALRLQAILDFQSKVPISREAASSLYQAVNALGIRQKNELGNLTIQDTPNKIRFALDQLQQAGQIPFPITDIVFNGGNGYKIKLSSEQKVLFNSYIAKLTTMYPPVVQRPMSRVYQRGAQAVRSYFAPQQPPTIATETISRQSAAPQPPIASLIATTPIAAPTAATAPSSLITHRRPKLAAPRPWPQPKTSWIDSILNFLSWIKNKVIEIVIFMNPFHKKTTSAPGGKPPATRPINPVPATKAPAMPPVIASSPITKENRKTRPTSCKPSTPSLSR